MISAEEKLGFFQRIGEKVERVLGDAENSRESQRLVLELVKILARDKNGLEQMVTEGLLKNITHCARLERDFHGTFPDTGDLPGGLLFAFV